MLIQPRQRIAVTNYHKTGRQFLAVILKLFGFINWTNAKGWQRFPLINSFRRARSNLALKKISTKKMFCN
jgi:hypothetical protein